MRVDFVKKNIPADVEGSKKGQKGGFWKNGKLLIVNQPVQLESWKKRWMCGFSSRLRQNIKKSKKSLPPNFFYFKKSFFWHFLDKFFSLFCDICTLEKLLNGSGLRKYQKYKKISKMLFFGGPFWTERGFIPMES